MKRKVTRMGQSSLVITLPAKWARENGVKKGDEVEVETGNKKLILYLENRKKEIMQKTIQIEKGAPFLKRYLNNLYRKGYDEIKVVFEDISLLREIQKCAETLIGFEILEYGDNFCIIRNVAAPLEKQFDGLLRKLFQIDLVMGRELIEAIQTNNFNPLREIAGMEKENNKLYHLCVRILTKGNNGKKSFFPFYFLLLEFLEQIGDDLRNICRKIEKNKGLSSASSAHLAEVINFFDELYQFYYSYKISRSHKIKKKRESIHASLINYLIQAPIKDRVMVHYLLNIISILHQLEVNLGYMHD